MTSKGKLQIPFTFGIELEFVFAADEPAFRKFPGYLELHKISNTTMLKALQRIAQNTDNAKVIDDVSRILQRITYDASVRLRVPRVKAVDDMKDCAASIAKISNTKGWGTSGCELISRVLPLPASRADASLEEVNAYAGALGIGPELNDPWLAVGKLESTGLHVHIGVSPDTLEVNTVPLPVLRELAFFIAKYEYLISFLHNPARGVGRAGDHRSMLNSNLFGLSCPHGVRWSLDEFRSEIFAPVMTINKLATLVSKTSPEKSAITSRFKFVNFENMMDYSGKNIKTLEFRQHSCTLNAEEISQWVWFLTHLVRTAEAQATGTKKSKSSKSRKTQTPSQKRLETLTELMQLLKLYPDARTYWRNKLCREDPKGAAQIMADEVCLKCAKAKALPTNTKALPTKGKAVPTGNKRKRAGEDVPIAAESKRARHSCALRSMMSRTIRIAPE